MSVRRCCTLNIVMREEKKYLLNFEEYIINSHMISQVLAQDKNNKHDGYMVRSLYFDTIDDKDFHDKQAGIEIRRKIRLRLYDPKGDFAVLEMKQKQGEHQLKRSLKVSKDDAILLCKGIYTPLLHYSDPFATEVYGIMHKECYRPKIIVEYQRMAFIAKENKIRITFDHHIRATESCFDIFSENLCMYPVLDPYNVVMEVKYNGFLLSYIKDLISRCSKSPLSVSKYCLARQVSLNYLF